jgi:hypothetical protein
MKRFARGRVKVLFVAAALCAAAQMHHARASRTTNHSLEESAPSTAALCVLEGSEAASHAFAARTAASTPCLLVGVVRDSPERRHDLAWLSKRSAARHTHAPPPRVLLTSRIAAAPTDPFSH